MYPEIKVTVQEEECVAVMVSYYEGYRGTYLQPPEPEEAEFILQDLDGCRWFSLEEAMTSEEYWEISEKLCQTYRDDIADERAIQRLNKIRGK